MSLIAESQIRFGEGAAYDRMMGTWSRLAGGIFLDWLVPRAGLRWINVGCGNGAFTELLADRCAPAEVQGIDPSEASSPWHAPDPRSAGRCSTEVRGRLRWMLCGTCGG